MSDNFSQHLAPAIQKVLALTTQNTTKPLSTVECLGELELHLHQLKNALALGDLSGIDKHLSEVAKIGIIGATINRNDIEKINNE